jgi:DNA-binding transcriptional MerR regulator
VIVTTSAKRTTINGMTREEINDILHQLHQEESRIRTQYQTLILMRDELDKQTQSHQQNVKQFTQSLTPQ